MSARRFIASRMATKPALPLSWCGTDFMAGTGAGEEAIEDSVASVGAATAVGAVVGAVMVAGAADGADMVSIARFTVHSTGLTSTADIRGSGTGSDIPATASVIPASAMVMDTGMALASAWECGSCPIIRVY